MLIANNDKINSLEYLTDPSLLNEMLYGSSRSVTRNIFFEIVHIIVILFLKGKICYF